MTELEKVCLSLYLSVYLSIYLSFHLLIYRFEISYDTFMKPTNKPTDKQTLENKWKPIKKKCYSFLIITNCYRNHHATLEIDRTILTFFFIIFFRGNSLPITKLPEQRQEWFKNIDKTNSLYKKVTGCLLDCISVPKVLANRKPDMVLLHSRTF